MTRFWNNLQHVSLKSILENQNNSTNLCAEENGHGVGLFAKSEGIGIYSENYKLRDTPECKDESCWVLCLMFPVYVDIFISIFSFIGMFCRWLFVLLYFFFWPLYCMFFFDIQILIAPLVSSNSSFLIDYYTRRVNLVTEKYFNKYLEI
jgi:hypothetical protein